MRSKPNKKRTKQTGGEEREQNNNDNHNGKEREQRRGTKKAREHAAPDAVMGTQGVQIEGVGDTNAKGLDKLTAIAELPQWKRLSRGGQVTTFQQKAMCDRADNPATEAPPPAASGKEANPTMESPPPTTGPPDDSPRMELAPPAVGPPIHSPPLEAPLPAPSPPMHSPTLKAPPPSAGPTVQTKFRVESRKTCTPSPTAPQNVNPTAERNVVTPPRTRQKGLVLDFPRPP